MWCNGSTPLVSGSVGSIPALLHKIIHAGLKCILVTQPSSKLGPIRDDMQKCENDVRCHILNLTFRLGYDGSIPSKAQSIKGTRLKVEIFEECSGVSDIL